MEILTLEQIYYLGQTIAAGAVIITLIYVGLEVRQNTHAINLSTAHNVSESFRDSQAFIFEHADLCEIWFRGLQDLDSLSGTDELRFYTYMHNLVGMFQDAYYSWKKGALDPRLWDGLYRRYLVLQTLPGWHGYWESRKFFWHDDFVHYIDEVFMRAILPEKYVFPGA